MLHYFVGCNVSVDNIVSISFTICQTCNNAHICAICVHILSFSSFNDILCVSV